MSVFIPRGAVKFIVAENAYARHDYYEPAAALAESLTKNTGRKHRVLCVLDLSPENVRKLEAAGLKLPEEETNAP